MVEGLKYDMINSTAATIDIENLLRHVLSLIHRKTNGFEIDHGTFHHLGDVITSDYIRLHFITLRGNLYVKLQGITWDYSGLQGIFHKLPPFSPNALRDNGDKQSTTTTATTVRWWRGCINHTSFLLWFNVSLKVSLPCWFRVVISANATMDLASTETSRLVCEVDAPKYPHLPRVAVWILVSNGIV